MTALPNDWIAAPGTPLFGTLDVPGDKSVSHRAIMLAALADGVSRIDGFLEGEDTRATAAIFAELGVRIEAPGAGVRIVHGVGVDGLQPPQAPLDCGNAGTGMRLLAGVLAGQRFDSVLTGDASLSKRPMQRVIEPLASMGARIEAHDGLPPLRINGGQALRGIDYTLPVASAQVKSALLLAGLYADGETRVREPHPTRDYTERMLAAFGYPIAFVPGRSRGARWPSPARDRCAGACRFLVGRVLHRRGDAGARVRNCDCARSASIRAAPACCMCCGRWAPTSWKRMPAEQGGEPVADLVVRHAPLRGIEVPLEHVADMIDEFPALFVAAACADGATTIRGAAELRVKESDRIATMSAGLRALGIQRRGNA